MFAFSSCFKAFSRGNVSSCCKIQKNLQIKGGKKFFSNAPFSCRSTKLMHIQIGVARHTATSAAVGAELQQLNGSAQKWVGRWLLGCSGMVFGAVALGGLTRLTESGLSMTDWHLFGKRPPLSHADWVREFERYKQFPEYKQKNMGMSLSEFQFIWWMEYGHRQWGRAIGAFFAVPAAIFWYRGYLNTFLKKRVLLCGVLLGCQGLLGWYMVQSGLDEARFREPSDVPRVSQYRLMSHLGTAFVLYSVLLYNALHVLLPAAQPSQVTPAVAKFRRFAHVTKGWVFLTAMSGALVAGLDAGLVYNSFPKMADRWVPTDLGALNPPLRNITENPTTVQFDHRILGTTSLVLATAVGVLGRRRGPLQLPPRAHAAAATLAAAAWMQVGLGISTLLLYVPVWLASLHQCGSLAVLSAALWLTHELKYLKRLPK